MEDKNKAVIQVSVHGRTIFVPAAYMRGYMHVNCYPHVLKGETCYGGIVEQRCQYLLSRWYLNHNDLVFVDIGAGCGVYSILAEERGIFVHAFEPSTGVYNLLRQNLKSGLSLACHVALTDKPGQTHFIGKWGTHNIRVQHNDGPDVEKVEAVPLDVFDITDGDVIMKIDTEGMGVRVLKGGLNVLRRSKVVIFELHDAEEFRGATEIFYGNGFQVQAITESHIIAVKPPYKLPQFYETFTPDLKDYMRQVPNEWIPA